MHIAVDPDHPRTWPTLSKVVELFVLMGCERHPSTWAERARFESAHARAFFLINPELDRAYIHVMGIAEEECVPPSLVEYWEERLRTRVPHNWPDPDPDGDDGLYRPS